MADALRANIDWKSAISLQRGQFELKFQVDGIAPTNHSSHKTGVNVFHVIKNVGTRVSFVLSQITRVTDR